MTKSSGSLKLKGDSNALYEAASTAVTLAGGSFLSVLIAGLGSLVLARVLGPEGYGAYSLVLAVPAFLASFVDLGMSAAMVRYIPRYPEKAASYVTLGVVVALITSSLITVIGILTSSALSKTLINRPEYSDLVLISMPYLLSYSLLNVSRASLIGMGKRVKAALLDPIYNFLRVSLSIALAVAFFTKGAVLGIVIASAVTSLVGVVLIIRSLSRPKLSFSYNEVLELLQFSIPLYVTGLVGSVTQMYTTLMLSRFFTDFEIGNYRAALNLLSVISIAIAPFSTAFLKVFSELGAQDFRELFTDSIKYVALFSTPLTLFSSATAHDIVRVVYGRRYTEANVYFSMVVLVNTLTLLGSHVVGPALSAINKTKYILVSNILGSLAYVPLLYVLARTCGLQGAVISYLSLNTITTLAQLYFLVKSTKVSLDYVFSARVLVSAVTPSLALIPVAKGQEFADSLLLLALKFVAYIAVYVALLAISRTITESDVYKLSGLSKSLGPLSGIVNIVLKYATLLLRLLQR
ncbi:MAG: oligosaccharide flippase family protein [Sulfolobales archaeon]